MSDILRWQERKTRKPHRCWGCGKLYPSGTTTVNAAYKNGGTVGSCYWCRTCQEYMNKYFEYGDEVTFGEIYSNDLEGWEKIKEEVGLHE